MKNSPNLHFFLKKFHIYEGLFSFDTIALEVHMNDNPGEFSNYLRKEPDLKGRVVFSQDWKKNWNFNFDMSGFRTRISVEPGNDTLFVIYSVQKRSFITILNQMHMLRGF